MEQEDRKTGATCVPAAGLSGIQGSLDGDGTQTRIASARDRNVEPLRPCVTIIIVNYNTRELLRSCLESVMASEYSGELEVLIVDNASTDGSVQMARSDFPEAKAIALDHNFGYGGACNAGMAAAGGSYFLLTNTDIELQTTTIESLVSAVDADPSIGIAGCQLVGSEGELQECCFHTFPHRSEHTGGLQDSGTMAAAWISGALMLIRRECWNDTGGFDPDIFLYAEELDWCYRAKQAGWKIVMAPDVRAVHLSGQTSRLAPRHQVDLHLYLGNLTFFLKHYDRQWTQRYTQDRRWRELRGTIVHKILQGLPGQIGRKHRQAYLAYACRLWYWVGQNSGRRYNAVSAWLVDAEARSSADAVFRRWMGNRWLFADCKDKGAGTSCST